MFENYPVSKVISSRAWLLKVTNVRLREQNNYPLGIAIGTGSDISIAFNYNAGLIEESYIQQLAGHFEQVLGQIIDEHASTVGAIDIITETERHKLLFEYNNTQNRLSPGHDHRRPLYTQAAKTPDNIAVVFEATSSPTASSTNAPTSSVISSAPAAFAKTASSSLAWSAPWK